MKKATDAKSTAKPAYTTGSNSTFFGKESGDAFFAGNHQPDTKKDPFFVQTKLRIGKANDHYETEADTVADKVVQRLGNKSNEHPVQTKPAIPLPVSRISQPLPANDQHEKLQQKEEQEATEESLQRKPIFDSMADPPPDENVQRKESSGDAGPATGVQQRLHSTKGGGQPLPEDTRSAMESTMGADFSQVKVHTGAAATSLNNDLQAQAFTHGRDIYFNEGKFDPSSSSGKHLLAHELTHTIQQGAAPAQRAATDEPGTIRKTGKPGAAAPAAASGEIINIAAGNFNPSEKLKEDITTSGSKGLDVGIVAGNIAGAGTIRMKMEDGQLQSVKNAYLPLNVPFLATASPTLAVSVENGQVKGFGTIGNRNEINTIPKWLKENEQSISWLTGINVQNIPIGITNTFEGGVFTLLLTGVKVKVGGFADATMDVGFENMQPTVHVVASIDVKGMAQSNLDINMKEGGLSGEGTFAVAFASFSGNIEAKFTSGVLDVKGTVSYSANKLEGALTLVMTDQATADNFARSQLGVDPQDAQLPAEVPAAGDKPGPRALAGMGTLTFNLTEWFAGSVNVIVDGKGRVTVIGKIAPPKEIILFEQKDYIKELFKLEARASYGVPLIGNVFVFANVSLSALAKIGPAKIYNIEVAGTYSTDPAIAKSITLSGSLNMSAYAGLRLRAEGGAGLQLLGHDLKLGVGVNADAGVKGYVDARPTIGYRDPGEFFFKGHMEIAAQPFLGLSGDLFVELDSPWWSPIPDNKWTWPIGALEYPLPGEFGIGADMEYVLGSGKIPEVSFSEAKFDGAKFMTDLVDDHVPKKGGGDKGDKAGKYVDGGAATPAPGKGQTPGASDKGGKKGAQKPVPGGKGKDKKGPDADKNDEMKRFGEAMKKVKELESRKPMTKAEITAAVEKIKSQHKITSIAVAAKGTDQWLITGSMKGKGNKQSVKVKANMQRGDDKPSDKEKEKKLQAGIAYLEAEDKKVGGDGKMTKKEAQQVAKAAKAKHDIFKSLTVIDAKERWDYAYVQRKKGSVRGELKDEPKLPKGFKIGDRVKYDVKCNCKDKKKCDCNIYIIHSVNKDTLLVYLVAEDGYVKKPQKLEDVEKDIAAKKIIHATKQPKGIPKMSPCDIVFKVNVNELDFKEYSRQITLQERAINAMTVQNWWKHKTRFDSPGKRGGRHKKADSSQARARRDEARQIKALETARLTAEFMKNNGGKNPNTRQKESIKKKAAKVAKAYTDNTAALHGPDQTAGGHFKGIHGLGNLNINSSIGSQWDKTYTDDTGKRADDVESRNVKLKNHVKQFMDTDAKYKAADEHIKAMVKMAVKLSVQKTK